MNNLKNEMKRVWDYVSEHPGVLNYDIALDMQTEFFTVQALLTALEMDSYVRKEPRKTLLGGAYYWVVRVFP